VSATSDIKNYNKTTNVFTIATSDIKNYNKTTNVFTIGKAYS